MQIRSLILIAAFLMHCLKRGSLLSLQIPLKIFVIFLSSFFGLLPLPHISLHLHTSFTIIFYTLQFFLIKYIFFSLYSLSPLLPSPLRGHHNISFVSSFFFSVHNQLFFFNLIALFHIPPFSLPHFLIQSPPVFISPSVMFCSMFFLLFTLLFLLILFYLSLLF